MDSITALPALPGLLSYKSMFEAFRNELDEHQDRRERIIKASRDITALSKKIIFSLQRVRTLQTPIPPPILKEISTHHHRILDLFNAISPELHGSNAWRYQRQVSSCIQEFIEALSFWHYLETQTLLRYSEAQAQIPYNVMLTEEDYALGLFDLSGELMRFAITSMATTGTLPRGREDGDRTILGDLRLLRLLFESLDTTARNGSGSPFKRDVEGKLEILKQSVEKVEVAAYGMIIRGRERPKGCVPEVDNGVGERRGLETYQSGGEA